MVNGHVQMTKKLAVGCRNLFKGCTVAQERLLMRFCELRDYPNRANTSLRTYYDLGLRSDRRYVYTHKADKEIGHRSKQTSEIVTKAPAHSRGTRNPAGTGPVIPTSIRMPTTT